MSIIPQKELHEMINRLPHQKFVNEHGEAFTVSSNGVQVFIEGDETDGEVLDLFNSEFNIWSSEELYKLGIALQGLARDCGYKAE